MPDEIPATQISRAYYRNGRKPSTEKMKADAAAGAGRELSIIYHPLGDDAKTETKTTYSNGNEVTICESGDDKVTTIKIDNKTYYDWESDGKIDCVDTETIIEQKIEEKKREKASICEQNLETLPHKNMGI